MITTDKEYTDDNVIIQMNQDDSFYFWSYVDGPNYKRIWRRVKAADWAHYDVPKNWFLA